jgi:hypothetical protein
MVRIHAVLCGMQNRTLIPYLAPTNRILISNGSLDGCRALQGMGLMRWEVMGLGFRSACGGSTCSLSVRAAGVSLPPWAPSAEVRIIFVVVK